MSVDAQGSHTVLNVSEAGETATDHVIVTGSSISSSLLGWTVDYSESGVGGYAGVNFATGTGTNNVVSVQGDVADATTVIVSAGVGGITAINVVSPSPNNNQGSLVDLLGQLSILDTFGEDFLTVSDVGSTQPDYVTIRNNENLWRRAARGDGRSRLHCQLRAGRPASSSASTMRTASATIGCGCRARWPVRARAC